MYLPESDVDISHCDAGILITDMSQGNVVHICANDIDKLRDYITDSYVWPEDETI